VYSCTTQRVRRILFPEIMIDDDLTTADEGFTKTTLSQFYEPTRKLKESIIELLSIRSQFSEASNNIPQFIQKLSANDQVKYYKSMIFNIYTFLNRMKCNKPSWLFINYRNRERLLLVWHQVSHL